MTHDMTQMATACGLWQMYALEAFAFIGGAALTLAWFKR